MENKELENVIETSWESRDEINENLPIKSTLGKKQSDIFGEINFIFYVIVCTIFCHVTHYIPINIFLRKEVEPFKYCIMTMNSKDVKVSVGPTVNLNNMSIKRVKRKNVQLIKKIKT